MDLPDALWVEILAWLPLGSRAFRAASQCKFFRSFLASPSMKEARRRNGSSKQVVIAFGGSVIDWPDCCKYPQQSLYDTSCFVLLDGLWQEIPPLPTPVNRRRRAAACGDGFVYVMGLFHDIKHQAPTTVAAREAENNEPGLMYRFDISLQRWEVLDSDAVVPTGNLSLLLQDKCLRVAGDFFRVSDLWASDGNARARSLRLHTFEKESKTWSSAAPVEDCTANRSMDYVIAERGDKLYLIGGRGVSWDSPRAIITYDPAVRAWAPFGPLPEKRDTRGHSSTAGMLSAVGHAGGLVISGGGVPPTMLTSDEHWVTLPPIPKGREWYSDCNGSWQHPCECTPAEFLRGFDGGDKCTCLDFYKWDSDEDSDASEEDTREVLEEDDELLFSVREWMQHAYDQGSIAGHVLLSVEWA